MKIIWKKSDIAYNIPNKNINLHIFYNLMIYYNNSNKEI